MKQRDITDFYGMVWRPWGADEFQDFAESGEVFVRRVKDVV